MASVKIRSMTIKLLSGLTDEKMALVWQFADGAHRYSITAALRFIFG
jgi:hypothetical protein